MVGLARADRRPGSRVTRIPSEVRSPESHLFDLAHVPGDDDLSLATGLISIALAVGAALEALGTAMSDIDAGDEAAHTIRSMGAGISGETANAEHLIELMKGL